MTNKLSATLLLLLFTILYLLPLQGYPLFIPDETRYAEVPREMVASGDWVVPRLNGLRYFEKPVMGYWLSAVSLWAFGENNFAVRLPSALTTGLTALLIFFLCSRSSPADSKIPWLASLVYLTSLGVGLMGTLAILDTPLTLFLTATLVVFFMATEEKPGTAKERVFLLTAGLFAGCAFLTKGFLAFAIPVLAAAPYLIVQGRWRDTLRMLPLPVTGTVLVSLPWAILMHLREPDFWNYFFWNEHVRRFLADDAQHSEPVWFFLAALPLLFLPWTLLLPAAIAGMKKVTWPGKQHKRLMLFCLCWFLFPFLFFSASSGKLITYILPCMIPLAILFSHGMEQYLNQSEGTQSALQWAISLLAILILFLLLAVPGLHLLGPERLWIFQQSWKWQLLSGSLAVILSVLTFALRSTQQQQKIVLFGLSFAILLLTFHFTIPTLTLQRKAPGSLLARHARGITPATHILSGESALHAVGWYFKRDDIYLVENAGETLYGINHSEIPGRLLDLPAAGEFIRKQSGQVVLVADQDEYRRWQPFLPEPISIDSDGSKGYLLLHF